MDIILSRPAASSGELLLAQIVWTFPTPASLTPPSGWTLVAHIFGTQIQESVYQQSGPLPAANETWTISSNQAWSASVLNVGTAAVGAFSSASGNTTTLSITAPVIAPTATDMGMAFYGVLNLNPIVGLQTPGVSAQGSRVSSFWEYHPSYAVSINMSATVPTVAAWIEIMLVLTGTPSITPTTGLATNTCPIFSASGG